MKKTIYSILICMMSACFIIANAQMPWHVDSTYGITAPGLTSIDFGIAGSVATPLRSFRTSSGNIATVYNVAAPSNWGCAAIAMTSPSGVLVTSYGTNGIVMMCGINPTCFGGSAQLIATGADMGVNDRIFVCGAQIESNAVSTIRAFIYCFDSNGSVVHQNLECTTLIADSRNDYGCVVAQPNGNALCFGSEAFTVNGGSCNMYAKLYSPTGAVLNSTGVLSFYGGMDAAMEPRGVVMSNDSTNVFAFGLNIAPGSNNTNNLHFFSINAGTFVSSDVDVGFPLLGSGCTTGGWVGIERLASDKIRIAVTDNDAFATPQLMQYTSNLVPDNSFGTNGIAQIPTPPNSCNQVFDMDMDANGNSYIFGSSTNSNVKRALPSGALDNNFPSPGGTGELVLPFPFSTGAAHTGLVLDAHHVFIASQRDSSGIILVNQTVITDLNTTGVASVSNSSVKGVTVYPNPAHDNLTIAFAATANEPYKISLTDALGRTVLEREGASVLSNKNTVSLNIENLSKGIYMIALKHGEQNEMIKVAVE